MTRGIRKILALFLALSMVFSLFAANLSVLAETPTTETEYLTIGNPITVENSGKYAFIAPKNAGYVFWTEDGHIPDTWGDLLDSEENRLVHGDDTDSGNYNFRAGYEMTAGETYYIDIHSYSGGTFTLHAAESNVSKVEYLGDDIQLIEHDNLYGNWFWEEDPNEQYFHYEVQMLLYNKIKPTVRITYKDGTSADYVYGQENSLVYTPHVDANQSYQNPWDLGENEFYIYYEGVKCAVPVEIIETPIEDITVVSGDFTFDECDELNGNWYTYTDPETKEEIEYFHYSFYQKIEQVSLEVEYKNGEKETVEYLEETEDGLMESGIGYIDEQYYNPWEPNKNNTIKITYKGFEKDHPITINASPISSIEVVNPEIFTFNEGDESMGGWCEHYIDGTTYEYFSYDVDRVIEDLQIKINYTNNTTETVSYDEASIYYNAEQDYLNQWKPDGDNTITITYKGKKTNVSATLIPNHIQKIEVESIDFSFIEKDESKGNWSEFDNGITSYDYFYYDVEYIRNHITLKVTYSDDTTETIDCSEDYETANQLSIDSRQYKNPWTVGGENLVYIGFKGRRTTSSVCVVASNISSIVVSSCDFAYEECDEDVGDWHNYYGETIDSFHEYFYYEPLRVLEQMQFTITYTDGTSENIYYDTDNPSFSYNENQFESHWYPDGENILEISYNGKKVSYNVKINPSPVEKIELAYCNYTFLENDMTNGHWETYLDDEGNEIPYFHYYTNTFICHIGILVTYNDGREPEVIRYDDENGNETGLSCTTNQNGNPWVVGGNNIITIRYKGAQCEYPVEIQRSPIASIEIYNNPYTLIENFDGYLNQRYNEKTEEYENYFHYNFDSSKLQIKVTYNDGREPEIIGLYDEEGNSTGLSTCDTQESAPWVKGGNNTLEVSYYDKLIYAPVSIIDSPVERIEVKYDNNEIIAEDSNYGNWEYYTNEETGEELRYFLYDVWSIVESAEYTVYYNDGRDPETFRYYDDEGNSTGIIYNHEQHLEPWTPDKQNYFTVGYMGGTVQVPVVIKKNPVESIFVLDIDFTYPLNDEKFGNISYKYDEFGNETEYFEYDLYYARKYATIQINYTDGTSETVNGDELNDLTCMNNQSDHPFVIGENEIPFFYMGKAAPGYVQVVQMPDFETEDFEIELRGENRIAITGYIGNNTQVIIPETISGYTVVELCDSAFYDKSEITSIKLPDTVETIGDHCFGYCYNLTELALPKNLKNLDRTALSYAGISKLTISEENQYFKIVDGVLFSKDGKTLCYYPRYDEREEYTVPIGTEIIGDYSISSDYLKKITLPEGLIKLGEGAFSGAIFDSIKLPESLTEIGAYAFNSCYIKYLYIPKAVKKIGYYAFNYSQIEYITISKGVKEIENDIFDGCEKLKGIYFIGTEEEFGQIEIDPSNDVLFSTEIYYISEEAECSHSITKTVGAIQKDCWNSGYSGDEICVVCSKVTKVGEVIAEGHTNSEPQNVIEATCHTEGYTGDIYCTDCEELISWGSWYYEDHIPEEERRNAYDATCNDCGYTGDLYCSVCDNFIEGGEYTDPTYVHNQDDVYNAYEASCYSNGYTGDKYCSVCGTFMASGEIIPASHGEEYLVGKLEPTCAEEGYSGDKYCSDCNDLIEYGEVLAPYGDHIYNVVKSDVDYHWYECGCGTADTESKTAHSFDEYTYNNENHWLECECGYKTASSKHSFDTLKTNDQQHYYECVCGMSDGYENHDFTELGKDDKYHWYACSCGVKERDIPHNYVIPNNDETHHWNECACGEKDGLTAHSLYEQKTDETYHWDECDCGWVIKKETHNFANTMKDELYHWDECDCGCQANSAEHTYDTPNADENSHWIECSCGAIDSDFYEEHSFNANYDADYHWDECNCGKKVNKQEHYFNRDNKDTENHWIECVCGAVNSKTLEPHNFSTLNTNSTQHWYTCSCGHEGTKATHTYNIPCNDTNAHWNECECGAIDSDSYEEHSFNANHDTNYHWDECACGKTVNKQEHNYNKGGKDSENHWNECDCGTISQETIESHNFDTLNTNDSQHWYTCSCGQEGTPQTHTYNIPCRDANAHWNECECGASDSDSYEEHKNREVYDETHHWNECRICNYIFEESKYEHVYSGLFILDLEVHCFACACGMKDFESVTEHKFDDKSDKTHHWKECVCGAVIDKQAHNFNQGFVDNTYHWKECSCGAYDTKELHSYDKYYFDGKYHYKTCDCGMLNESSKANHKYVGATCTANGKCVCGATGGKLAHKYGSYLSNGTHHWKQCSCKNVANKAAHTKKTTITKKATITASGKSTTTCTVCKKTLSTTAINKVTSFKLSATTYTYSSSKTRKPTVTVKDYKGKKLVNGTDYTVKYASGRKNVGKYKVTITLKGKYSGTKTLYFTIKPANTSIKSISAGSKKLTVKWAKKSSQVSGYEIQYSTSSSFKSAKTAKISSNKTTSKTIKSLKAKKKYYIRIRTYTIVGGKKFYSDWSSKKYKTTKK